ncbi:unnamed protein product [Paramecium octaurelia]|uniref:Uncharacterized protein n=1 Tax=Paramecium octaurelia TaxID=43137 RepID=A0A8S1TUZ6_PAROT|nr:unnamed protein product [Paramecium octaurelia]
MHTSRSAPSLMTIEQMYSVVRGETGAWGIEGYEVPKKYCDPLKQAQEREFFAGKLKKPPTITKRGHFLDDIAKPFRNRKVPVQYNVEYKWVNEKDKERKRSKSELLKRNTFIDDIFLQNSKQNYPKPGPGKYDENRSIENQAKKWNGKTKIQYGDKPDFVQDYQHLGAVLPAGPGSYNPHPILPKLKHNNTNPKVMIAKHKDFDKFKLEMIKNYPKPDCTKYKPYPVDYNTFGRSLELLYDKKKIEPAKIKYWGNPSKPVTRNKSEAKIPPQYNLIAYWPGKEDGSGKNKELKKFNWMNKVTKGIQQSIYY